jgi:hypothetical protein
MRALHKVEKYVNLKMKAWVYVINYIRKYECVKRVAKA